jgi:glycosyltransferase involved in cell wall biosynthesis
MISIAMATYNGELFIREQLDSILTQTLSDWELIVCDDGSTDNTLSILQEYANNDSRIKIYQNETNLGFKRNFEKAIGLCSGEYIALCDQDDIWYPNHLEILLNLIGNNSLSIGNSDIVDTNNTFLNKRMSDTDHIHFIPKDYRKLLYREFFYANPFQGASMLLKKEFALKCIPIPDEVHYHDTWLSTCACLDQGLVYTYTPITRYRQHGKNITINNHREKGVSRLDKYIDYTSKIIKTISNTHYSTTDRFAMAECLKKRFNKPCEDFNKICSFLNNARKQKLNLSDIKLLWKNMTYITTTHSKREFLRLWFLWSHMYPVKLNK